MSQGAAGPALAGLHGFARALTSFVGRASQLDEVAALLSEYRFVTVTGPGGVGKTRLAAEVAGRLAGRFADGVWLVELAGVSDPALVPAAVATALELVTLVAQGRTNAQIAGQLFISVRTVGSHLDRIRDKTGCRRRTDLTRLALQAGLV